MKTMSRWTNRFRSTLSEGAALLRRGASQQRRPETILHALENVEPRPVLPAKVVLDAEHRDGRLRFLRHVFLACVITVVAGSLLICAERYRVHRHARSLWRFSAPKIEWTQRTPAWLLRLHVGTFVSTFVESPVRFSVGNDAPSDELITSLLQELSGLENISIYNRDMASACFRIIASRHRPKFLSVCVPTITADDARWLAQMPSTEILWLSMFPASHHQNDWSWLKSMPRLKSLHLALWHATDADVLALSEVNALEFLELHQATLSDAVLNRLTRLPRLERLTLDGKGFRLHFAEGVRLPATLQSCDLKSERIDSRSLDCLIDLPKLTKLEIDGGQIDAAGFQALSRLPALRQLWLPRVTVTDDDMEALANSPTLGEVLMDDTSGSPTGLAKLMGTPHWWEISFGSVRFSRKTFRSRTPEIWEIEYELEHSEERSQERLRFLDPTADAWPFPAEEIGDTSIPPQ